MTSGSNDKRAFNGLKPKEWTKLSRSVWLSREVSSTREKHHLEHGATFSTALAERAIKMYTAPRDLVLDPFLGVGTTIIAAGRSGRRGIGIELYRKFAAIAESFLGQETTGESLEQKVICGDSRNLLKWVEPESVQLVFTSPPYANFIHRSVKDRRKTHKKSKLVLDNKSVVKPYGSNPEDFGNLNYEDFLAQIKRLMADLLTVTVPGGYNVWVVKDCRDTENGVPLVDVHSDIARLGRDVGFLYHDLIIWDQNDQRSLVLLGYPSVFYVNVNHTFLVVLRKPQKGKGK
jgi:DNA modification methylase